MKQAKFLRLGARRQVTAPRARCRRRLGGRALTATTPTRTTLRAPAGIRRRPFRSIATTGITRRPNRAPPVMFTPRCRASAPPPLQATRACSSRAGTPWAERLHPLAESGRRVSSATAPATPHPSGALTRAASRTTSGGPPGRARRTLGERRADRSARCRSARPPHARERSERPRPRHRPRGRRSNTPGRSERPAREQH